MPMSIIIVMKLSIFGHQYDHTKHNNRLLYTILIDPYSVIFSPNIRVCLTYVSIREDDFLRNNAFLLHDLNGHVLAQQLLCHETCNFSDPFLGHHYFILSVSYLYPGV